MKLLKLIASKAGRVVFDDRLEAASPREAREQMGTLLGLQSLTGVVYAVTAIPVQLIESTVDARITHAMQRLNSGQPPESIDNLIRPTVGEEVRSQLANMREQIATASRAVPAEVQEGPQRFDAFATAPAVTAVEPAARRSRRTRPTVVVNGESVDWKAVKRLYMRTRSIKQTAAHFELSPNTVKARIRRKAGANERTSHHHPLRQSILGLVARRAVARRHALQEGCSIRHGSDYAVLHASRKGGSSCPPSCLIVLPNKLPPRL